MIMTSFLLFLLQEEMETYFKKKKYVTMEERLKLSQSLNLDESQIKIWFQNRRAKLKRLRNDMKNSNNFTQHLIDVVSLEETTKEVTRGRSVLEN